MKDSTASQQQQQYFYYLTKMHSQKSLQLRRVHTNSEENHHSLLKLNRVRLNSLQNQEEANGSKINTCSIRKKTIHSQSPSPNKYYQSRLTLSCESWSAYNLLEKKYKRGWKPNKTVNFTGLLPLVLLNIYYMLERQFPWLYNVSIRVNRFLLKHQQLKLKKSIVEQLKLQSLQQKKQDQNLLTQNTIIRLKDLIIGNFFMDYSDLKEYSIIFLGVLLKDIKNGVREHNKTYHFQEHHGKGPFYQKISAVETLVDHINGWMGFNEYSNTTLTKHCELYSSPDEVTRIFSLMLARQEFQKLLARKEIICTIKFQTGYHFYEQRKLKFINDWPTLSNHLSIKSKNNTNYAVISFNKSTHNVIALYDCKFSMEDIDLKRIQDFLEGLAKPIVQKKDSPVKLPILRLSE